LTKKVTGSAATVGPGTLTLIDDRVFGPAGGPLARHFARRVLRFVEIRSLALDPSNSSATLAFHGANGGSADLLMRLADAVVGNVEELDEAALPRWPASETVTLYHHREVISLLEILSSRAGHLLAHHPVIGRDPTIALLVEEGLRITPGVITATAISAKAQLRVHFNPRVISSGVLIRLVETGLLRWGAARAHHLPSQVNFSLANVSLGFAATGEFVLPVVNPVTAGMLVLSNLETFRVAARQARHGKFGLPVLYSSIVGVTLATGQFLSAALMFWFFRYWEHRYRQDLAAESETLLQTISGPKDVEVFTADGEKRPGSAREIAVGDRVRASAGEAIAVDARVLGGVALVDEMIVRGTPFPVRRVAGDHALAGSQLIAGALDLVVLRTGEDTRAAHIRQSLIEAAMPAPNAWALNQDAEEFAGRAVGPTFFAAGAGLVVGDLTMAGAILRPDYATGVGLAAPLETLRDVKLAGCNGIVIRLGTAFERLASTSWVVLEDHERLHHRDCELEEVRTNRRDEAQLLLAAAAAGVWLGDERGPALVRACQERGLIVRRADLHEIGVGDVITDYRGHVVRLRGCPITGVASSPLSVEFDGIEVAEIRFRRNEHPTAAETVRRLQTAGLRVFLASERRADATTSLAAQLGVDRYCGDLNLDDKIRLLIDLRRDGVGVVFVGDCVTGARAARKAHLAITLAGALEFEREGWDVALLGPSIEPLPALFALAHDHTRRIERARHAVIAPNLLCVAGAFSFGLSGLAAVFISNFGTSIAYNNAVRSLRTAHDPAAEWRDAGCFAGATSVQARPQPPFGGR
jgi:Cu2+-exporting ATPase